jgi:hypothetical protein
MITNHVRALYHNRALEFQLITSKTFDTKGVARNTAARAHCFKLSLLRSCQGLCYLSFLNMTLPGPIAATSECGI